VIRSAFATNASLMSTGRLEVFTDGWIAIVIYVAIALMWLVPDRRIESVLKE
jgi:hypothetical protein